MGGEYRCIHFRTGALGQGSRTALPILRLLPAVGAGRPGIRKVSHQVRQTEGRDITSAMYNCQSYYMREKNDSTNTDSIHVEEEIVLDENGAPIERHSATEPTKEARPSSNLMRTSIPRKKS